MQARLLNTLDEEKPEFGEGTSDSTDILQQVNTLNEEKPELGEGTSDSTDTFQQDYSSENVDHEPEHKKPHLDIQVNLLAAHTYKHTHTQNIQILYLRRILTILQNLE